MSKEESEDKMAVLTKFVDDNFRPTRLRDVFLVSPQLLYIFTLIFSVLALTTVVWIYSPTMQWGTVPISVTAILIAFYSLIMAFRKFVNKRLANMEAKRLSALLPDKSNETLCLLPALVALKQENYYFAKLTVLYEVNKDLFKPENLIDYYYFD